MVADDPQLPETWSATENVAWKAPVPGLGWSSPIVWGDRVFLTSVVAEDEYEGPKPGLYVPGSGIGIPPGLQPGIHRWTVLCLDLDSGELLWQRTAHAGPVASSIHPKNSFASATPVTDGERVYASFGSRGLVAVDFDGNRLWHAEVGQIDNYHGPAGSPLLYRDRVIVYQDQRGGGFVAAYDTRSGAEVWRTARGASVGWGTPVAIRVGDHDELIVSSQRTVNAYDPDTGAELWRCGGNNFEVIPTPVVEAGLVFCTSGRAGPTLAIRPGGSGDVTATHVAWTTPRGSPFVPSPLAHDGYLYTINDMASIVTCFRAATGEVLWQGRLGRAVREGFSASPVLVDGKVFFTSDDGITFVLRAGPEFELLHTNDIGARTLASPALVDGYWYIRTEDELIAIGS